jgi:3',5'-cyclic AMP phosphodiesterase CpdA
MKYRILSIVLIYLICICIIKSTLAENVEKPEFSFGVIADVQYCDCDDAYEENKYFRSSLKKLTECVQDFNSKNLAFVIQLGDFIEQDLSSYDDLLPIYQQLKMPKYHVLGNHDFSVTDEEKKKVLKKLGLKKGYYDFTYQSWRFIVLNGTDISLYATSRDSDKFKKAEVIFQDLKEGGFPSTLAVNGALSKKQIAWMKDTLDKASNSGEKVILFCHHPIFPQSEFNLWNNTELINIFESYDCVVAYMNGHNHLGSYETKNGIHYLTFQGMLLTPDKNAYSIIEVYKEHLKVVGYGRVPSRFLHIKQVNLLNK